MQCASSRKPNLIVQASWTDLIASVYAQSAWNIHTFLSVLINGEFITNVMQSTFNHYINVLSLLWLWNIIVASCILSALLFYDLSRSLFFHLYSSAQIAFISKFWTFFFALLFVQNHSIQSFKDAQDIPTRNISSLPSKLFYRFKYSKFCWLWMYHINLIRLFEMSAFECNWFIDMIFPFHTTNTIYS